VPRASSPEAEKDILFLDGLRGLAALYVMVGHARWLLWEGYESYRRHPGDYTAAGQAGLYFFSLFKYGHQAVFFFFVLSGFVIHLRYARQISAGKMRFDWLPFVFRRARRLYPPLLAALGLTFVLDSLGKSFHWAIYRGATPYPLINHQIASHLDPVTLAGNLAFLMDTYVPVYGTNGPLWSLKFEWWFYMVYPLFCFLSRRSVAVATGLLVLLSAASSARWPQPAWLLRDVFSAMIIWWLGALLADVFTRRIRIGWAPLALGSAILGVGLALLLPGRQDIGVSLVLVSVLAWGFYLRERHVSLRWLSRLKPLGDMSYTLYVVHFPVLVLLSGWVMSRSPTGLLPEHFGWIPIGAAVTLVLAYLLHFVVEKPFVHQVKRAGPAPRGQR
jgi:peptidoglycan/LPS O-acetylase OafA/YrhL